MAIINVLDDKTIDKIAAGEVIERPASVVKELVENAIDAGAGSISIEIKDGGISYIRITDNGSGIDRDQVRKAFMRHATSKIEDASDLFKICSLGFRGEALSSISAVSSVEILTKTINDFSGVRYVISGGREEVFEDVGVPEGTTIIVRNLFYNTPARRKFLKSPNTEASHITDLIEKLILSHPDISFKYMINGNDKYVSAGRGDLKETVYSVYGRDAIKSLVPIQFDSECIKGHGYIGKPEIARGNRSFELFFVNGRYVKSNIISKAVEQAYRNRLMLHKYPFVILYFDVDPSKIDINVHPTKSEIKFVDEVLISSFVEETVIDVLSAKESIPEVVSDEKTKQTSKNERLTCYSNADVFLSSEASKRIFESDDKVDLKAPEAKTVIISAPEPFEVVRKEQEKATIVSEQIKIQDAEQLEVFRDNFLSDEGVMRHRIIGQLFDTYWLVEFDNSLYIIDQHAAHEKVLYERLMKRFRDNTIECQMISPPEILSLSSREEAVLNTYGDNLSGMGFEWEHFGGHEYALNGVPGDLYDMSGRDYFITVLDDLAEGKRQDPRAVNDRIATMACKAAVKANMNLSEAEAKALIAELLKLENPYNCPHGRPCIIAYSKSEIEKLFKRIV